MIKVNKETFSKLNELAQLDFRQAEAMLMGINLVLGTKYGWLNRRVVYFDNPDASTCERYKTVHDAWANADE